MTSRTRLKRAQPGPHLLESGLQTRRPTQRLIRVARLLGPKNFTHGISHCTGLPRPGQGPLRLSQPQWPTSRRRINSDTVGYEATMGDEATMSTP